MSACKTCGGSGISPYVDFVDVSCPDCEDKEMGIPARDGQQPAARHFNELTPAEAERLACLAEECGEVVQAVGKILRHGYESQHPKGGPTNREALERECGDILATLDLLGAERDIDTEAMESARTKKHESRKAYFHHQSHHRIKP